MINRVFCYSKQEAKKNRNDVSIGKMILQIIVMVLLIVGVGVGTATISDELMSTPFFGMLFMFGFTAFIIWYAISFGIKFRVQFTGFATDTDNNVYFTSKLNNGENFVIGGIAAEGILDGILGNSDSFAGDLAKGVGTVMTLYSMNKSAKIMQNPEIIAKMVENATTTTGAQILQILKVHNYSQDSHKVKIWCDYGDMRTGKIVYNKKITIYKSYNCFNDLMNILLSQRGGK